MRVTDLYTDSPILSSASPPEHDVDLSAESSMSIDVREQLRTYRHGSYLHKLRPSPSKDKLRG